MFLQLLPGLRQEDWLVELQSFIFCCDAKLNIQLFGPNCHRGVDQNLSVTRFPNPKLRVRFLIFDKVKSAHETSRRVDLLLEHIGRLSASGTGLAPLGPGTDEVDRCGDGKCDANSYTWVLELLPDSFRFSFLTGLLLSVGKWNLRI